MKFTDVPGETVSARIRRVDGGSFEQHFSNGTSSLPISHLLPSVTAGVFDLDLGKTMVGVTPINTQSVQVLNQALSHGRAMLAQLSDLAADGSAVISVKFFPGEVIEMGEIEVGVDEYVEKRVDQLTGRKNRDISRWLEETTIFSHGNSNYFFIIAGPAIEDLLLDNSNTSVMSDLSAENVDNSDSEGLSAGEDSLASNPRLKRIKATLGNSFCIANGDMRFVVTATTLPDSSSIYVASKLTSGASREDRAILLAKGQLKFVDWTKTGKIQIQARAQLTRLTAQKSSYLTKWDEYAAEEGEIFFDRVREIGVIIYENAQPLRDGTVSVRIVKISESAVAELSSGNRPDLDLVETATDLIINTDLTFDELMSNMLREEEASRVVGIRDRSGESKQRRTLKVKDYVRETSTLILVAENLPKEGLLEYSMVGELVQIKRRANARKVIKDGRSANPQLGLLIEENGVVTSLRSPQKLKPLTAFVRDKVFVRPPTQMQELAIGVALNTPDIALIQGPPGTGKTTVIAAIVERLNEVATKSGQNERGRILLSGFQHDAVENIISRLSINGLPVPKFGNRSNSDVEEVGGFERNLSDWCQGVAEKLRAKYSQIVELEAEIKVRDLCDQYEISPTNMLAKALVLNILELGPKILGKKVWERANDLSNSLSAREKTDKSRSKYLSSVRRLRTQPGGFADDGAERASEVLVDLEEFLDSDQAGLLGKASRWLGSRGTPPFLGELQRLKQLLLVELTEPPHFHVAKQSDDVMLLADAAIRMIRSNGLTTLDKEAAILVEFLLDLENNPSGMMEAVSSYSYAFAATVQQSVGKEVQSKKGLKEKAEGKFLEYDYVILDEAARISPQDLMIAMSQGKKIILVGDHRQLPHIIDDDVARRMEEGKSGRSEVEWLKKSMFEYLFSERLKTLEERDGIQRRVTLDKQFRMHPTLGDFVSRNFYERFDSTERIESGMPIEMFHHDLPGTDDKPAIWIDVPESYGKATRSGTSWTRHAEVDAIVKQLLNWLKSPQGRDLSYGVITFYKAQEVAIHNELRKRIGDIEFDDKKLRVGTVDSFQGMEFDVVFLSVVRTMPTDSRNEADRVVQARKLFGHLCLCNRLNVSMSRQKKLLVVVGDSRLVRNDLAAEFIPGLVDFYKLAS